MKSVALLCAKQHNGELARIREMMMPPPPPRPPPPPPSPPPPPHTAKRHHGLLFPDLRIVVVVVVVVVVSGYNASWRIESGGVNKRISVGFQAFRQQFRVLDGLPLFPNMNLNSSTAGRCGPVWTDQPHL